MMIMNNNKMIMMMVIMMIILNICTKDTERNVNALNPGKTITKQANTVEF